MLDKRFQGHSRSGVVLLMVLAVLALMSILSIAFIQMSRLERAVSRNYVDQTRAKLAAESGVDYALSRLSGLLGGYLRPDEVREMAYIPDPASDDMKRALHASFQKDGVGFAMSGSVSSSYTEEGDYYVLRVEDLSGKLNINDTDSRWNIDDDPYPDDYSTDPDILTAPYRLTATVESLATQLFGDPALGGLVAVELMNARLELPGERFSTMDQVRLALVPDTLSQEQYLLFADNVTLHSWSDPNVLKPTFQLNIRYGGYPTPPATMRNVYIYEDFQTRYYEKEARSPVNVNTASTELLAALIHPVRGWYLYEGQPASMMDGTYGPWVKCMRASSGCWGDTRHKNGYNGGLVLWGYPNGNHVSPSVDWTLGNSTRYGEARITNEIAPELALTLAERISARRQTQPFRTWDEFTRFMYELVDISAVVTLSPTAGLQPFEKDLNGSEESQRMPFRVSDGNSYIADEEPVEGFDRYMADALLANFNPNAMPNDFNPDLHLFRHVDKTQLTQYTTELSFQPTGAFRVESLGLITNPGQEEVARARICTDVQVFHLLRLTTQDQFMRSDDEDTSYDPKDAESIYRLFAEYNGGILPAAGADIEMAKYFSGTEATGGGTLSAGARLGPSLCSYPEPLRRGDNFTLNSHPDYDAPPFFSKYAGSISLNTLQRDFGSYPLDGGEYSPIPPGINQEKPRFMATMGYRKISDSMSWPKTTLGAGGLIPVRLGNNNEMKVDGSGPVRSDELASMNIGGGQGVLQAWTTDWGNTSITGKLPKDTAWTLSEPWIDPTSWNTTMVRWTDHFWEAVVFIAFMSPNFEFGYPGVLDFYRLGWNVPSDLPLTPDVTDDEGHPTRQRIGTLYPDGAFSETSRSLSFPSTNFGSNNGTEGAVAFWIKPHWDAGYSNRIRQLFSMGLMGAFGNHALDLLYFPVGRRVGVDAYNPVGPNEWVGPDDEITVKQPINLNASPNVPPWPIPTHSFAFGSIHSTWGQLGTNWLISVQDYGNAIYSPTATDFFPHRIAGQRDQNSDQLAFYGHCWNYVGMSYRNAMTPGLVVTHPESLVEYSINGQTVPGYNNGNLYWIGARFPEFEEFHWFWEEGPAFNQGWGTNPMPDDYHISKGYMRFGWCQDNNGPTGDSTYDDIVTWANPVEMQKYGDLWASGRYVNEALEDPETGDLVNEDFTGVPGHIIPGMYTSPKLDLFRALGQDITGRGIRRMKLHSVSWTLWWPRYNWRPGEGNTTGTNEDYLTWDVRVPDLRGVDLHDSALSGGGEIENLDELREDDPVTGVWDPMTVDFFDVNSRRWTYSGASSLEDDASIFHWTHTMPSIAGGHPVRNRDLSYVEGDAFQYRAYFHLAEYQQILEAPTLDDITFTFVSNRPVILSWEVLN